MRKPQKASSTKPAQLTKPKITSARDPRWANAERTAIDLLVEFGGPLSVLGEVPFTASPDDPEAHGRELFAQAKAKQFGAVRAPSAAYLRASAEAEWGRLMQDATAHITQLEMQLDTLQDAEMRGLINEAASKRHKVLDAQIETWRGYRALLGMVPDQETFPAKPAWPEMPGS